MDNGSKVLLGIVGVLIALSVFSLFYTSMVLKDFEVVDLEENISE